MAGIPLTLPGAAFVLTLALAFAGTAVARSLALRRGLLRHPGARDSHSAPTPTGAGLAMVAVLLLVSWLPPWRELLPPAWVSAATPALLLMGALGWLDDRRGVPWRIRLAVQLLVSFGLLYLLHGSFSASSAAAPAPPFLPWGIAAAIALGWIVNAFNFMDGSDGMAGAQAAFAGTLLALLWLAAGEAGWAFAAVLVSAAALGFLPWNLPTARVFMGDAGSLPLGLALGLMAVAGAVAGAIPWYLAPLPLATFLVDSTLTLLLRILRGERWYTAHREHVYQKLMGRGWSHGGVLALYQGINWLLVLPVAVVALKHPELGGSLTGMLMTLLLLAWCAASLKLGKNLERP